MSQVQKVTKTYERHEMSGGAPMDARLDVLDARMMRPVPVSPVRPAYHKLDKDSEARAEIEKMNFEMEGRGYTHSFATKNGINVQEHAVEDKDALKVEGSFEYMSPEGLPIKLYYVADEAGFHPQGEHLPVAPAIPEAIARAIQWNEQHPEEEKEMSKQL